MASAPAAPPAPTCPGTGDEPQLQADRDAAATTAVQCAAKPEGKAFGPYPTIRMAATTLPTVWQEFGPLAVEHKAANLGQGFPDWPAPDFVKESMIRAVSEDFNQYCRSAGHVPLVKALAAKYSAAFKREVNPMTEVTVGVGASEALFAVIMSLVNPGDEVVVLEPAFDIYVQQIGMAQGVPRFVPLRPVDSASDQEEKAASAVWMLDMNEFRAAFNARTRAVIINTPHNPSGKVFTRAELQQIAAIVSEFPDVVVITDEVYEAIIFDGREHVHLAALPGMWDRTLTVSSAGKTFSVTGWKVGIVVGPAHLVSGVISVNQSVHFTVSTNAQQAVAYAMEGSVKPYKGYPSYYEWLKADYQRRRDFLVNSLKTAGFDAIVPEGSFFIVADTSKYDVPEKYLSQTTAAAPIMTRDWAFARWLAIEHGVVCIPMSAFYCDRNKHLASKYCRFAFCKLDESLTEAATRLGKFKEFMEAVTMAALMSTTKGPSRL